MCECVRVCIYLCVCVCICVLVIRRGTVSAWVQWTECHFAFLQAGLYEEWVAFTEQDSNRSTVEPQFQAPLQCNAKSVRNHFDLREAYIFITQPSTSLAVPACFLSNLFNPITGQLSVLLRFFCALLWICKEWMSVFCFSSLLDALCFCVMVNVFFNQNFYDAVLGSIFEACRLNGNVKGETQGDWICALCERISAKNGCKCFQQYWLYFGQFGWFFFFFLTPGGKKKMFIKAIKKQRTMCYIWFGRYGIHCFVHFPPSLFINMMTLFNSSSYLHMLLQCCILCVYACTHVCMRERKRDYH